MSIFTASAYYTTLHNKFENHIFTMTATYPRPNELIPVLEFLDVDCDKVIWRKIATIRIVA